MSHILTFRLFVHSSSCFVLASLFNHGNLIVTHATKIYILQHCNTQTEVNKKCCHYNEKERSTIHKILTQLLLLLSMNEKKSVKTFVCVFLHLIISLYVHTLHPTVASHLPVFISLYLTSFLHLVLILYLLRPGEVSLSPAAMLLSNRCRE